jgi:alginate O-acetyltransferase complex protein AlgI
VNPLFLIVWLPLVVGAFLLACRYRPGSAPMMLLAASLLFCFANSPVALALLICSILGNFVFHRVIRRARAGSTARSAAMAIGILANLAPLVALKLSQHGLSAFAALTDNSGVRSAIPLGLAYYALQQITFLIDASRPDCERLGFVRYASWISFFGQLPAGPIAPYARMAPQYARLGLTLPTSAMIARGTTLILAGAVKKTWLADPIARMVDAILTGATSGGVTPLEAWACAWGFMLQLYFDFSAYSDIAIGIGLCFGLLLPINFNSPLKSATPGQYVMQWHISLMMFVRDYVFQPMFKLARKLPIRPTSRRYGVAWALATLCAFLAVSAWHTLALIPFLEAFGLALVIVALQFLRLRSRGPTRKVSHLELRLRRGAGHVMLLMAASSFALLLRADSPEQLARMLPALLDVRSAAAFATELTAYMGNLAGFGDVAVRPRLLPNAAIAGGQSMLWLGSATVVALACPNTMQIFGIAGATRAPEWIRWRPSALWGWIAGALLFVALFGMTQPTQTQGFIYARF